MTQAWAFPHARPPGRRLSTPLATLLLLSAVLITLTTAMSGDEILQLREQARAGFRHGWENYWERAFPEDEVR